VPVDGLEKPCPTCGRPSGDHTLREWAACLGTPSQDMPYEATDPAAAELATAALRERWSLEDDLIVADHCVVRALTFDGASGVVGIKMPALVHEFAVGVAGQPPQEVAKVLYFGDTEAIRGYGRLVRDSANAAANASEGRAARARRRNGR
jgi:hypothetical protein